MAALDGRAPDRVPCALNFYHVDLSSMAPSGFPFEEFVDVDFVQFPISPEEQELRRIAYPCAPDTRLGSTTQVDTYARWSYDPTVPDGNNPLSKAQRLKDLESFPFPDVSTPYDAVGLSAQVQDIRRRGQAVGGNLPHLGGELFEAAWRLRGLENFLFDLVERPEWACFLLDRLTDIAVRNAQALAQAGVDVLSLDDDVGMPGSMMMSPDTWRRFFKPRMARIISSARAVDPELRIVYHSDGYFEPILPDLIDIGVNAINPLQPEWMDAAGIRRRLGNRLQLWGTIGAQTAFSQASPARIREETQRRTSELGPAGLILCPAYDIDEPDVRWENVEAFLTAARDSAKSATSV